MFSHNLILSPQRELRLQASQEATASLAPAISKKLETAFEDSSASGLLTLATDCLTATLPMEMRWWREFACECLTAQCHHASLEPVPAPPNAELAMKTVTAPPMTGIEYLDASCLEQLWTSLAEKIVSEMTAAPGGPEAWLQEQHSSWRLVGRVTFHLAENKRDVTRPFAFLATYTHQLSRSSTPEYLPLGKALQEYGGLENRNILLKLLSPIHAAAERSEVIRELLDTKKIFHPQAWTPREAYAFLKDIPLFEEAGLIIRMPNWWKNRQTTRPKAKVTIGSNAPGAGLASMLDFNVSMSLGDEKLSDEELKTLREAESGLLFLKGQWVEVDQEKLASTLSQWKEMEKTSKENGISFLEGMRLLSGITPSLGETTDAIEWSDVIAGKGLREQLEQLGNPSSIATFAPGEFLQATLRPYQAEGIRWLWVLQQLGLGACLADDMGLGKTLQVIGLLTRLKHEKNTRLPSKLASADEVQDASDAQNRSVYGNTRGFSGGEATKQFAAEVEFRKKSTPCLLVAPASLLANWQAEIKRFAPQLKIVFVHNAFNSVEKLSQQSQSAFEGIDLVATTYGMVARQEWLKNIFWKLVILDEAQAIKNHNTRQSRSVKALQGGGRIALTGTPVENNLGDLWSLFDFINPGLLGNATHFARYAKSLDAITSTDAYGPLRRLIKPYILRRLKTDKSIINDLPDKTEMDTWCFLTKQQAGLYQQSVDKLAAALQAEEKNKEKDHAIKRSGLVLSFLMRFKQICNHPSQLLADGIWHPDESGKFQRLTSLCEEIASRQEKVLIFTQFREMTTPLAEHLEKVFKHTGLVLHGGTSVAKRQELVTAFQREDGPSFFILSLKAGGTGLNLTAATHVIHFDRWWNPAVENQATDRAFRIGQKKNVLVHKFICRGTVEERIAEMINQKKGLADALLGGGAEKMLTEMNNDELLKFVALDLNSVPANF